MDAVAEGGERLVNLLRLGWREERGEERKKGGVIEIEEWKE